MRRNHRVPVTAAHLAGGKPGLVANTRTAATHGYTTAFTISTAILGLGVILAIVLLPSPRQLAGRGTAATEPAPAPEPQREPQAAPEAIPVALCSCSPVINPGSGAAPQRAADLIR